MLIDFRGLKAKHGMRVTGVLHVGAHECEEAGVYAEIVEPGARVVWVEGNPSICARMRARGVADVHEALVSDVDGAETDFIVTNNGQSSSILELAEHSREHPDVFEVARVRLKTVTLASLLAGFEEPPVFNFINLDIQGAELLALRGLGAERLSSVDYVYTEVNVRELYAGCALLPEMDAFLGAAGFERADTAITRHGWGDALYLRKSRKLPIVAGRYINLDSRPDRDAAMRDLAARLPFPVTRLSATARDNGALGCALSHVAALDELSAIPGRPDDWCVVLEDDFRLTRNGESALVPALSAALVPDNNAVLLSYRLLSPKSSVCLSPGTVELRGVYTASGYAVRRGFMPALRRCFHEAAAGLASGRPTPIDVAWFALQVPGGGFVGPCPKLGEQTPSYSDIERRHVDYGAMEHEVPPRAPGAGGGFFVSLQGGLGNQLFQAALGLASAARFGCAVILSTDSRGIEGRLSHVYCAHPELAGRPPSDPAVASELARRTYARSVFRGISRGACPTTHPVKVHREKKFNEVVAPPAPDGDGWVVLDGYFQSERHWEGHPAAVEVLRRNIEEHCANSPEVRVPEGAVALHVRRGDFVCNAVCAVLDESYYERAFAALEAAGVDLASTPLMVFTNDRQWCESWPLLARIRERTPESSFVDSGDDVVDLNAMSRCTHKVIANSTYSWWGAYMGEKQGSVVVAPKQWFGAGGPISAWDKIYPAGWIVV